VLAREPAHADALFLLGMVAAASEQFGKASELVARAIALEPARAEYHAQQARCLARLKRESDARAEAERALALDPSDALTLDTIGVVLSRLGAHERAAEVFRRCVLAAPRNPSFQFNLAASLRFLGHFEEAEQAYEATINLDATFYRAHSALSDLRKQTPKRNHVQRLLAALAAAQSDVDGELHVRHALAKEYEDLGDFGAAFEHLTAGKAKKRAQLRYSFEDDRVLFAKVEALFDRSRVAQGAVGHPSTEPVFVIGMPRTGTTLVERILSSHSQVLSAGELQNFGICLKRSTGTTSRRVLDEETLERGMQTDFAALGEAYLASTRPLTGNTPRFVDKMPLNFFYIGFIHFALPHAKIVCLRRAPLDTCVSNFRQMFATGFSYYNYAHDLLDIGRYYAMFDRLIRHWDETLPGKVLQLAYEDLVRDQEAQTRRLLEFCGLDWEPQCLDFQDNTAPVATASAVQVRERLYVSSIERWRRYADKLEPLIDVLEAEGISTGERRR
jgi:tetratricopeptide (TPR) repeat protein